MFYFIFKPLSARKKKTELTLVLLCNTVTWEILNVIFERHCYQAFNHDMTEHRTKEKNSCADFSDNPCRWEGSESCSLLMLSPSITIPDAIEYAIYGSICSDPYKVIALLCFYCLEWSYNHHLISLCHIISHIPTIFSH